MRKKPSATAFPNAAILAIAIFMAACTHTVPHDSKQVVIGELRDGVPHLTYKNLPKLKRALQLAFLPSMRIDTVFLHAEKMNDGELVVTLTASGRETDSTYTSVNFKMQRPVVGKPITWVPAEPRWCLGTGCTACWTFPTQCICNSNGEVNNPSCSTMPIVVSGGGTRPLDISDIIIPYLATE